MLYFRPYCTTAGGQNHGLSLLEVEEMKISGSDNHTEVYQYQFQFHFVYSQPIRIEADCTSTVRLPKKTSRDCNGPYFTTEGDQI